MPTDETGVSGPEAAADREPVELPPVGVEPEAVESGRNEPPPAEVPPVAVGADDDAERAPRTVGPAPAGEAENPVDALFARIRASRASDVADARRVLDDAASSDAPTAERRRPSATRRPGTASGRSAEPDRADAGPAGDGYEAAGVDERPIARVDAANEAGESATGSAERADSDADSALATRARLVAPAVAELTRSLKRVLRMEQNDLLDALRHLAKNASATEVLPGEATTKRLVESAFSGVSLAYGAGTEFFSTSTGAAFAGATATAVTRSIAGDLAEEIKAVLVRRLESGLSGPDVATVDHAALVNAAFREWKGARVESLAADYATRAFAQAVVDGAGEHQIAIAWIVDDGDAKCPDCDDNAVAGPQRAGDAFPTGHLLPPVHPGCRCLLVPNRS